jgi:hypothetical protein
MKAKNKQTVNKDDLCYEEELDEVTLGPATNVPKGALVSSFTFLEDLADNRKLKTEAAAATPTADGEAYSIGRYYKLRYSTARMLNEIKASHFDVNVYMNTIVDEAIRYYYTFGFKKGRE